jgi:phosphohistidine phosphatase
MRLLIIRHAIALERGTAGMPDEERPLTEEGEQKFREAAKGLARIEERPTAILTSPWRRARETAEIAARAWGKIDPRPTKALCGGTLDDLQSEIDRFPKDATIAVVGHEPWLSELLAGLLGTHRCERVAFKKGGVALVEVPGRLSAGGTLAWSLPPKVLRELAG